MSARCGACAFPSLPLRVTARPAPLRQARYLRLRGMGSCAAFLRSGAGASCHIAYGFNAPPVGWIAAASPVHGKLYCGLHEWRDYGFVLHLLPPGDTFG